MSETCAHGKEIVWIGGSAYHGNSIFPCNPPATSVTVSLDLDRRSEQE